MFQEIKTEIKETLRLAIPLASAQVGQAATGFVDTIMMGWLGQESIAAGGLGAITFSTLLITTMGVVVGISPLVAEAYGSNNPQRIQQLTRQGIWLSLVFSLPVMILLAQMETLMHYLGQAENVIKLAGVYLDAMLWGFFPALAFAMFRSVISSISITRPIMVIVIAGTLFNAVANYILGFGKLGFPAMGIAGIAIASAIAQWLMLLGMIIYICNNKLLKSYRLFEKLFQLEPKIIKEILWVGVPIAVSFGLEMGLFSVITYMMGNLGETVLAAHQIVFQTIVIVFMVPLGISYATTIRVGQFLGENNLRGVKRTAYINMCLGGGFMTIMAIAFLLFPKPVIGLYLDLNNPNNAQVIALASSMFVVAALSQILDGVQTTAAGALRGLQDTRIPMILSFLAFWGCGLGSSYLLGFVFGLGAFGLWLGQAIGVGVSAGVFIYRFRNLISHRLANQA